jgi:hypothetical protein
LVALAVFAVRVAAAPPAAPPELQRFDVVVAGGTTAAFAAALASAESGARTALIEPTDWVGGQLTASGVPAVDEAWHTIRDPKSDKDLLNVALVARDPRNITPNFLAALRGIDQCGDCWVSRFCFRPDQFLVNQLLPLQKRAGPSLVVYLDAVVKSVSLDSTGSRLRSLTAVVRTPRPGVAARGYDRLPSQDLPDWYSPAPSPRFEKRVVRFEGPAPGKDAVFVDATEWGEVLALSGAGYLQGVEDADGATTGNDRCGQATVYCFVEELHAKPADDPAPAAQDKNLGFGAYRDRDDAWQQVWTYRRLRGQGAPAPGDLCLQNWGYSADLAEGGNDYPFGYLLQPKAAVETERADWRGGVDLAVMAAAERRALAWHHWFKAHAPAGIDPGQITLNSEILGTSHGLAKLPYMRDTRRSIGLDGFVLRLADLAGPAEQRTGMRFADRIALGAYAADIHGLATCDVPAYMHQLPQTLPFYIPFRALTHGQVQNLLVAGKTMAQSFAANSATRLHPIEWSTGTAAGVAAAYMARTGKTSRQAYEAIDEVQDLVREKTPIDWTFPTAEEAAGGER